MSRPSLRHLVVSLVVLPLALSATVALPSAADAAPGGGVQVRRTSVDPGRPSTWRTTSPKHWTPRTGPTFNNPYGKVSDQRRILSMVIRAIDSVPGYVRPRTASGRLAPCPSRPRNYPATIRISLFSVYDDAFASSLIRASRRCVSVRLLMNNHLDEESSKSWGRLKRAIGNDPKARSFTRRCIGGCRGHAVLHSKFFLLSQVGRARNVTMVGSSNMTSNATGVQWNDLFTVAGNATMRRQYTGIFKEMVHDRPVAEPLRVYRAGRYTSTFYPYPKATRRTDRTMAALNSIRCKGTNGGAGIKGRSVVYIAMHSWHGTRGRYLAQRVRTMYNRGCYVRILYSFMGHGTYRLLTERTGPRMMARRVLFRGPHRPVAAKYSHMKMFAASGRVAGDRSAWVTWTGSNNWADRSIRADEVTLRIPSRAIYRRYVDHWWFMKKRRSSKVWASYPEPSGGGRPPEE